jgi:hypothetical protein
VIEPTDLDWLALCLCTESNRPEEWPAIAQVIENRLSSGRWGNTYKSVILAPQQFSAFNDFTKKRGLSNTFALASRREVPLLLMWAAAFVGNAAPGDYWTSAITRETLHYYSPVSMKPPGSKPPWAAQAKRLYTPSGIAADRFVFAEGVP